jgi:hypothetical protein
MTKAPFCVYNAISPKGKFYVGYTSWTAEERFEAHVKNSRKKDRKCAAIEDAIKHYGAENMVVIEVRRCQTQQEACEWEEFYTKFFKTTDKKYGYNLKEGGKGGKLSEQGLANHREAMKHRVLPDTTGPRAATAEEREDAIERAKEELGPRASKRAISKFAADMLNVSDGVIKDHMKRIGQEYDDGRRISTDEQIVDELNWVMSMDFADMMRKTLIMDMVGNIFDSSRIIVRSFWRRYPELEIQTTSSGWTFEHTEEAKRAIGASKLGKKKDPEEIARRQTTKWENTVSKYALLDIDISKNTIYVVLKEYQTAYKAAKYITRNNPDYYQAIRSVIRTYVKQNNL